MNELSKDRAYSILFIADYERGSVKWQQFVDTIINNLLGKSAVLGGSWMKFSNLPPITVSVIDKAETKEQAFKYLQESRYDVVIVNNGLDGKPIGGGMLKRFRQYHPDALFIPLLDITQKKGVKKKDGTVCTGDGLLNLFNAGFYNGLYKNSLNVGVMINIIHAGGRPKESAYGYYGFEKALIETTENVKSDVTSNNNVNNNVESERREKVEVSQANAKVSGFENQRVNNSNSAVQKDASVSNSKGVGVNDEQKVGLSKDDDTKATNVKAVSNVVPSNSNNSNENVMLGEDVQPLSNRKRRKLERERRRRERDEQLLKGSGKQESESTSPVVEQPQTEEAVGIVEDVVPERAERFVRAENTVVNNAMSSTVSPSMNPGEIAAYSDNPQVNEMMEMMKRRGCMNSSMVVPGALYGRVVYGNGNTVLIELDKTLEQVGLNFADIFNVPVVIPYTKFGDIQ